MDDRAPAGALAGQTFAVLDLETTGLSARRHRIVQVAVVRVDASGNVLDRWSTLVRKPFLRPLGGRAIHGLRSAELRRAPRFKQVVPDLVRRLDGSVLVAHNVGFDWAFLSRALRRSGYAAPDATRICTLKLSRSLDQERLLSHRLADVADRHGLANHRPHDALADAELTAALLPRLLEANDAARLDVQVRGTTTSWPAIPPSRAATSTAVTRPA
ncbi:MAG TPA: 3'-5' exonuclease [Acidimicrobiales bacterium]